MQTLLGTTEYLDDQRTIVRNVFDVMAEIDMMPTDRPVSTDRSGNALSAVLYFAQPSEGAVLVECDPELAYTFTARLMAIATPGEMNDDVVDSIKELVNMIGGNLKGLMPPITNISMPVLLQPEEVGPFSSSVCKVSELWFRSDFGFCGVTLSGTEA